MTTDILNELSVFAGRFPKTFMSTLRRTWCRMLNCQNHVMWKCHVGGFDGSRPMQPGVANPQNRSREPCSRAKAIYSKGRLRQTTTNAPSLAWARLDYNPAKVFMVTQNVDSKKLADCCQVTQKSHLADEVQDI